MSWDSEFYNAALDSAEFSAGINDFYLEYKPGAVAPYAAYQLINASSEDDLDKAHRVGERLIQLSVWAASPTQAKELAEAACISVQNELNVNSIYERSLGRDDKENLSGYAVDFYIWFQNP